MGDQDIRDLSRLQLLYQLFFLRRYAYAKLVYESVLHGGSPTLWKGLYDRPAGDPMAVYRDVFSTAYAVPMDETDALRFRTDVDDTFYSADYARSFALAHLMHEGLRGQVRARLVREPRVRAPHQVAGRRGEQAGCRGHRQGVRDPVRPATGGGADPRLVAETARP